MNSHPSPTTAAFRPPLTLLLLVAATFAAVRPIFERATSVELARVLVDLLLAGEFATARSLLVAHAGGRAPRDAYAAASDNGALLLPHEAAALAVVGALDAVTRLGAEVAPRRFHARVALNGHNDLGVCLVEEARLAGADALRCTQLCASPPVVHWVRAASVYQITEVTDDEARDVVDAWQREREAERRQMEARIVRARTIRQELVASVQRKGQFVYVVAGSEGVPKYRALTDAAALAALRGAGFDGEVFCREHRAEGLRAGYLSADDAEQSARDGSPLVEALRALGFREVTVVGPSAAHDEAVWSARPDDNDVDFDHEGALA